MHLAVLLNSQALLRYLSEDLNAIMCENAAKLNPIELAAYFYRPKLLLYLKERYSYDFR